MLETSYSVADLGTVLLLLLAATATSTLLFLYVFLWLTTTREPDLHREPSERQFTDPVTGTTSFFPDIGSPPELYISLVVPAYKEEDRLPKAMQETIDYLEKRQDGDASFTYEVVIVNDGSPDGTSKEALKFVEKYGTEKVRLLEFVKNMGKGGAVRMGCLSARGERILFLDADGATEISDIEKLEKALTEVAKTNEIPALAIGSRAHLQDNAVAKRSFFRNFLMHGFHMLVYMLCVRGVRDTQCGFKMMTRPAAVRLFQLMHINRWAFDVELLYIAQQLGMPIREVAVNWQEIEGSKLTPFWSWLQMGRDLLFIRLRYSFSIWTLTPLKHKTQ